MQIANLLSDVNVATFVLLFIRFASFFSFIPFFNFPTIPMSAKAAFSLWLAILFYPLTPKVTFEINAITLFLAIISEVTLAFLVGSALNMAFDILRYAAEQISFVMGFTMASVFDPNFGVQSNVIGQFFIWVALLVFFAFGGDHLEIWLIAKSLHSLPFGAIFNIHAFYQFFVDYMYKYFLLGFSLAFPILAVSLFSDIVFAMIMKTMPQFNLLVVGFPIKITIAFLVLMAILGSIMQVFQKEMINIFNTLSSILS